AVPSGTHGWPNKPRDPPNQRARFSFPTYRYQFSTNSPWLSTPPGLIDCIPIHGEHLNPPLRQVLRRDPPSWHQAAGKGPVIDRLHPAGRTFGFQIDLLDAVPKAKRIGAFRAPDKFPGYVLPV